MPLFLPSLPTIDDNISIGTSEPTNIFVSAILEKSCARNKSGFNPGNAASMLGNIVLKPVIGGIPTAPKVVGMSKRAVQALLAAPDPATKAGRRDIALMVAIYSTATRLNEILSLQNKHLYLKAEKPYMTIIGKGDKIRSVYLLPKTLAHLKAYIADAHGAKPLPDSYVFYSRNKGLGGQMCQNAVNKQLKKHAITAHEQCGDVPLDVHAHQLRHAKASHWLEDGMNIVQISFLLGHAQLQTTMVYIDITTEQEAQALATLEDEADKKIPAKWKTNGNTLAAFCGVKTLKKR
jgi:site-specific recombinase XerC